MATEQIDYEAVLADLKARRDALDQAIAGIEQVLGKTAGSGPIAAGNGIVPTAPQDVMPRSAFTGMKMPDAIKAYLRAVTRKQTPKQIADSLTQGGYHSTAKNLYAAVYTTLIRMEKNNDVGKFGNEWGLVDWFPGYRQRDRSLRPATAKETEVSDKDEKKPVDRGPRAP